MSWNKGPQPMELPEVVLSSVEGGALLGSEPCQWAIGELESCLRRRAISFARDDSERRRGIVLRPVSPASKAVQTIENLIGANLPATAESFVIAEDHTGGRHDIYFYAPDPRGMVYAITELADRARYAQDASDPFELEAPIVESPSAKVRSISRCFVSDVEDLGWFHDRDSWTSYLSLLATHRFNRIALTLGMQYNYPYGNEFITDVYFYLAYPFLVSVPGHDVRAVGLPDAERAKNLETLKFIAREARRRGLDFQLALWTQNYDFDDCPNANYRITGITPENRAAYCRDALAGLLREVPDITGLTLRVHVECGIPEGSHDFWRTYFEAVSGCGRTIEIDLHAKGIDDEMIGIALATGMPVTVSPKYISEHMGLPYHQASIRSLELPPGGGLARGRETLYSGDDHEKHAGKWKFSEGTRKFMRYSYGDLLREGRPYGIIYRIWPGTQRVLLWGDPALAAGYGRSSTFCGSLGVELCEPLSFKGRMGTGIAGGRDAYEDRSLATGYDWQKFAYTYRVWGRSVYRPDTDPRAWRRYLKAHFGDAWELCETAIANASRVLPFIVLAHAPTASNNSYWPEIYENMSIVREAPQLPYGYELEKPARFGTVGACDSQLFLSPDDFARALLGGEKIRKIAPLTCANWLDEFATVALERIARARGAVAEDNVAFRRFSVDVTIQGAIGKFFAEKIRAAVLWELYLLNGATEAASEAVVQYRKARDAWAIAADECREVYRPDITYGPHSWLRGRWDDRLPAIESDLAEMETLARQAAVGGTENDALAKVQIGRILGWSTPQRASCHHAPPAGFIRGESLELSCTTAGGARRPMRLHYRHTDQSERWRCLEMTWRNGGHTGRIPGGYTDSPHPLQYYFEIDSGEYSEFCPGLEDNLANEPYFVVRQS